MAGTVGGAIRALVVVSGLVGARAWNGDDAPKDATLPYITIQDPISLVAGLRGDGGSAMAMRRLTQLDLWQARRKKATDGGGSAVDPLLPQAVFNLLDGVRVVLDTGRGRVWRIHVDDTQRIPAPPDTNTVHHAFTLSVKHDRAAI